DRETSGVLILAKKRSSLCILHQQLREKKIQKEYIALVHGIWPNNLKKISEPLLKTQIKNKNRKVFIHHTGKASETWFKIIKKYTCFTLIKIFPKTGRTHQIRVHTLHAGHPIVFDKIYQKSIYDNQINKIKKNERLL
ncbi:MAG: pseudouridine synthase, partial [Buchnera aphidicola]|nr:pseudouridine synthase [Buchnera aphidicola]